ncbi:MAG: hypothetical protein WCJ30_00850 [Deltaproteobacteria bacterium]
MRNAAARTSRWLALSLLAGMCHCAAENPAVDAFTPADAARADARTDVPAADAPRVDTGTPVVDSGARDVPLPPADVPPTDPYAAARDSCVAEINRYRAMNSLPPYARWAGAESCADQMAANDAMVGTAHDGFQRGICAPGGNGQNECPGYGSPSALNGCLAQMWAEGPTADGSWDTAHGHYLNMIGDYTYMGFHQHFTQVACGFSAGGWMVQNFQ